jgi:hypothetical protein
MDYKEKIKEAVHLIRESKNIVEISIINSVNEDEGVRHKVSITYRDGLKEQIFIKTEHNGE